METEAINVLSSFALSGGVAYGAGYGLGWVVRLIAKVLMAVAGGLIILLLWLQSQEFLSINWLKMENWMDGLANSSVITQNIGSTDWLTVITSNLGIPVTSAVVVAFPLGFLKGIRA